MTKNAYFDLLQRRNSKEEKDVVGEKPLQPIEVFIDLENVGVTNGIRAFARKIDQLLIGLRPALHERGYCVQRIHAFASWKGLRKRPMYDKDKRRISEVVTKLDSKMHWSKGIADDALIGEIEQHLTAKSLPYAALLITDDGGFVPIVQKMKGAGHRVVVAGEAIHRNLLKEADEVIQLDELLV